MLTYVDLKTIFRFEVVLTLVAFKRTVTGKAVIGPLSMPSFSSCSPPLLIWPAAAAAGEGQDFSFEAPAAQASLSCSP